MGAVTVFMASLWGFRTRVWDPLLWLKNPRSLSNPAWPFVIG